MEEGVLMCVCVCVCVCMCVCVCVSVCVLGKYTHRHTQVSRSFNALNARVTEGVPINNAHSPMLPGWQTAPGSQVSRSFIPN